MARVAEQGEHGDMDVGEMEKIRMDYAYVI